MLIKVILDRDKNSTETRIMRKIVLEMEKFGHTVDLENLKSGHDVVIANGVGVWRETKKFLKNSNNPPLFIYEWDCYPWTYPNKLEYIQNKYLRYPTFPKKKYKKVLVRAQEIFCPSTSVIKRIDQMFGLSNKCVVVRPFFEPIKGGESADGGYIFHPVRKYKDPQLGWLEKFSEIHNIPVIRPEHRLSKEEYEETVLNASLVVTEYTEASTGGLTLLEAFARGKKILFCDSEYMGANDYFPKKIEKFREGSFEDFSNKILKVINQENFATQAEVDEIINKFSISNTANEICLRLLKHLGEK
jgi:hypothetical protein